MPVVGPWWKRPSRPPGIPPDPLPLPVPIPRIPPYVGNTNTAGSNLAPSSLTLGLNANAGDGVILFVLASSATLTYSASDNFGSFYSAYGVPVICNSPTSIYLLWCVSLAGTNPTITVASSAGAHQNVVAIQIVGANSGWFIDAIANQPDQSLNASTPQLRSSTYNDLIVIACGSLSSAPSTLPAGFVTFSTVDVATSQRLDWGYSTSPQPIYTFAPIYTNGSAVHIGTIGVAIRTIPNFPSHIGPRLPILPPGRKAIPAYPYTLTSVQGMGIASSTGIVLSGIAGSGVLTGGAVSSGLVFSAVLGKGAFAGTAFAQSPVLSLLSGSGQLSGRASAAGPALAVDIGNIAVSATAFATGPALAVLTGAAPGGVGGIMLGAGYALASISFTQFVPPAGAGGGPGKLPGKKRRRDAGPYMRDGQVFGEEYAVSPQAGPARARDERGRFIRGVKVKMEMLPQEGDNSPVWSIILDTTFTDLDD